MSLPPSTKISASVRHNENKFKTFKEYVEEKLLVERKTKKRGATIHSKGGSFVIP